MSREGRAREASSSEGESCVPGMGSACFVRLDRGDVVDPDEDVRFLEVRLAAESICFAIFSSGKIDCMAGKGVLERVSGLRSVQRLIIVMVFGKSRFYVVREASFRSLTLVMATGTGTFAS